LELVGRGDTPPGSEPPSVERFRFGAPHVFELSGRSRVWFVGSLGSEAHFIYQQKNEKCPILLLRNKSA